MKRTWLLAFALNLIAVGDLGAATIVVTDDVERTVRLQKAPTRIVTLEPFLTELVFALGRGAELVGIAQGSRYPFETYAIPKVRGISGFMQGQAAVLKPDLVIASIDSIDPDQTDRIAAMGTAVAVVHARRLNDVPRLLRLLGTLTEGDGESVARDFEHRLEKMKSANLGKPRVSVMIEIQHRPLTTVSAGHFLTDALEICAASNVFSPQIAVTPEVPWELVYRRNPRAIVGFGSASGEEEFKGNWAVRRALEAVREGRLLYMESDVVQHPTPRTPDDVARLCKLLDTVRP